MKFSVQSAPLKEALSKILTVVDKKSNRAVLTNCLFTVANDVLSLSATDLEVSALIQIKTEVIKAGSFCINAKNISEILREMPDDVISFEITEENKLLKLKCRQIDFSLLIAPTEEFPSLSLGNDRQSFKIKAKELLTAIMATSHAISTDETRLFFNGIYLQRTENSLRAVASDGHRLAWFDINDLNIESTVLSEGIIIPKKGIFEIKKLAESVPGEEEITLSVDESFIYVNNSKNYFISSRLIARDYPKYQAVVPKTTIFNISVDQQSFLTAIKRIRIMASEKSNAVRLSLRKNQLLITANHPSLGEAKELIDVVYDGKDLDIGFNAKYLVETLSLLPHESTIVNFGFNNELSPVLIRFPGLPLFLSIIMPLKL